MFSCKIWHEKFTGKPSSTGRLFITTTHEACDVSVSVWTYCKQLFQMARNAIPGVPIATLVYRLYYLDLIVPDDGLCKALAPIRTMVGERLQRNTYVCFVRGRARTLFTKPLPPTVSAAIKINNWKKHDESSTTTSSSAKNTFSKDNEKRFVAGFAAAVGVHRNDIGSFRWYIALLILIESLPQQSLIQRTIILLSRSSMEC